MRPDWPLLVPKNGFNPRTGQAPPRPRGRHGRGCWFVERFRVEHAGPDGPRATQRVARTKIEIHCSERITIITKPFNELTRQGKLRRLRRVAEAALERYDVAVRRVTLVSSHLNLLYRVDTESGERFALRISNPIWRSPLELASELQWLVALARETDIGAHEPLPNRDGELITVVEAPGVPEARRAVLFTWVPGVEVAKHLTPANVEQMGVLSARLHQHGATFRPDGPFTERRLQRLFPRDEQIVLFDPAHEQAFTAEQRGVFERMIERAQGELDRLYSDTEQPRVVHGDLHHENIKIANGKLHPIDFEDVIWAYPIQDIALTFYDYRYYTDPQQHDYAELCAGFERGYRTVLPWPQEYPAQIDVLHAARQIWVANWVLQNEDPRHHAPFITRLATRFETLLNAG